MVAPLRPKSYYSKQSGLCIAVDHGKLVPMDGEMKRAGEKFAQFVPLGTVPGRPHGEQWGNCVTSDPDVIAFLDDRVQNVGDVINQEQFSKMLTPADQQLDEKDREIQRLSNLVDVLKQQGKIPAQK